MPLYYQLTTVDYKWAFCFMPSSPSCGLNFVWVDSVYRVVPGAQHGSLEVMLGAVLSSSGTQCGLVLKTQCRVHPGGRRGIQRPGLQQPDTALPGKNLDAAPRQARRHRSEARQLLRPGNTHM